ncbi:MAG: hypothetical protein OXF05_01560 [Hyphomicrobiales bacterium]|nr:hypothetical protein [Hyphomicrobiales bacterium]MCY4033413.1 hypothetical protein [Hyphomicrobiales bacterium]MCY4038560.1 hypothetical protein [Hyphomicrobiales bacterium]
MSDYRFPTEDEESALIEEVSRIFMALGMESTAVPVIPEEFAKMLFTLKPDIFGDKLENAERWLQERIETAEQEVEDDQSKQEMKRFLSGFPTTTPH